MQTKQLVTLFINGQKKDFTQASTIRDVLDHLQDKGEFLGEHFAVALNMNFVPRALHSDTKIRDNDALEILSPMQGG